MCPSDKKLNQGISPAGSLRHGRAEKARYKLCVLPKRLTYAALVDRQQREIEITELMTRRACDEMDAMQQFPFAAG